MSEDEYENAYRVLGVGPGDSWDHVQSAYRRLVRDCHPDRHTATSDGLIEAEEATKELNLAFSLLSAHYRQFGALPPVPFSEPEDEATRSVHEPADRKNYHTTNEAYRPSSAGSAPESRGHGILIAAALILGGLLIYVYEADPQRLVDGAGTQPPAERNSRSGVTDETKEASQISAAQIRPGASALEVNAIQGAPSAVEKNIWHYGQSKVYFENGRVTGWISHPENPLSVLIPYHAPIGVQRHIHVGDTKEEVRSIQGDPIDEQPDVWDYGISRVYFSDGRVTGWHDSPLQQLRTGKPAADH